MNFELLGKMIKNERLKLALNQADLAQRIDVGQQTIGKWEAGRSRPTRDKLLQLVELFKQEPNDWLNAAGYELPLPVRPRATFLPLHLLSPEQFELFSLHFVKVLRPDWDVSRFGGPGDKQDGIDLYAKKDGRKLTYQCKRRSQFGPGEVNKVVKANTVEAEKHYLLLARPATAQARTAMDGYDNWILLDRDDIAAEIRRLPIDDQKMLVQTFFQAYLKDFLGIEESGPWQTPEQYFQPFSTKFQIFSHEWSFVGRKKELAALKSFVTEGAKNVVMLAGRGGVGKTRLLKELSDHVTQNSTKVFFAATGVEIEPKHLDLLPRGNVVIVIDDAHERYNLSPIIGGIIGTNPKAKIILSTRPYGVSHLQDDVLKAGATYDFKQTVTLTDLKQDEAEALSKQILEETDGDVGLAKQIAAVTKDCPLATVVGSKLVATGQINPALLNNFEEFRQHLLRSFRDVITAEIGGNTDKSAIRELLDFIALVQPINPSEPALKEIAEKVLGQPEDVTLRRLNLLEDAGVLLRRGSRLRIVPDLLADYIRASATYDDRRGKPTGYADRVFAEARDNIATNVLVNLSQLDWRISATGAQAELLKAAWESLEEQFLNAKIHGRIAILSTLEKVAYYQPVQALNFVRLAMNNPTTEETEYKVLSRHYKTSYKEVLHKLAPILGYVAHHLDHLTEALDILKELAENDQREINPHADHPKRILQDLATIEPNKPQVFNELIADHAISWLSGPQNKNFSPFDVLDILLATEGNQTEFKGITLTMRQYRIIPGAVKHLRDKVLDAAYDSVQGDDLHKAFRAMETIENGLQGSIGGDPPAWEPIMVEQLERLEKLVKDGKLHPVLFVKVREVVSWHANFSKTSTKPAARRVLEAIPTDLKTELTRGLIDGWGWTFERDYDNPVRDEAAWNKWRNELALSLLNQYKDDYDGLIGLLEQHLEGINKAEFSRSQPGPFIGSLCDQSDEFGLVMAEYIVKHPQSPISTCFGIVLMSLRNAHYDEAISLSKHAVATGDRRLTYWVSRALGWLYSDVPIGDQEIPLLKELSQSEDPGIRNEIVRAAQRFNDARRTEAVKFLLSIDLGSSKETADEVLEQFGKHGKYELKELTDRQLDKLLERMVTNDKIDDYNIENFFSDLSFRHPLKTVEFLMKRIEHKEKMDRKDLYDMRYDALPYRWEHGTALKFHETDKYVEILRRVRDWSYEKPDTWERAHYGADLFNLVSAGYDKDTLNVLQEWILSSDQKQLEHAAQLLSEAGSSFVWDRADIVIDLLNRAAAYGQECLERVISWMSSAAISGSRSGTIGQPYPEDIKERDRSQELINKLAPGTPAYKFYKSLHDHALWSIDRSLKRGEELEGDE